MAIEYKYRAEIRVYDQDAGKFETVQLVYVDNLPDVMYYLRKYIDDENFFYNLNLELFKRSIS